jgi:hypothetical protein
VAVSEAGFDEGRTDDLAVAQWYDLEVPGIVAGLESSAMISDATAGQARRLVDQGQAAEALAMVLAEAGW